MTLQKSLLMAATTIAAALAGAAQASPVNLVQNGSFENSTAYANNLGTEITNSNLAGWTISGCTAYCYQSGQYTFLAPTGYSNAGFWDSIGNYNMRFYGAPGASPDGGNAIAMDATWDSGSLSQTLTGLNVGDRYAVSFYQASMQEAGNSGAETDTWQVSLGGATQSGTAMNNPSQGGTGWVLDTLTFYASSTSEALSFFATANNGAQPPFLLLDGVSAVDLPEPASLGLMAAGLAGLLAARRKRRGS